MLCQVADEARQRLVLQDMYKYLLDDLYLRRYDMVSTTVRDIAHLDDGTRDHEEVRHGRPYANHQVASSNNVYNIRAFDLDLMK